MSIERIDLRRTSIRITLAAIFGGTLLGLYHAFSYPPAVTEQPPPANTTLTPPAQKPPETAPRSGHEPKLQLSTRIGSVLPATVAAPSLKLSTRTTPANTPRAQDITIPGNGELTLGTSASLTTAPAGKSAELEPRIDTASPLHLSFAEGISSNSGTPPPPPRRNTLVPLHLSIAEEIDNLPVDGELALDASPGLTAIHTGTPEKPEPQPGEPGRQNNAPVLPTPERSGSRRLAQAENKPGEGDSTSGNPAASDTTTRAFGWTIPPINYRWGGQTGLQMSRSSSSSSSSSEVSEFINLRGSAASYIYQPWFARVNGNIDLGLTQGKTSSESQSDKTNSLSISGGGALNLFPSSRFPGQVTYDVSNLNNSSTINTDNDLSSTRFGIRQSYRPVSNAYNVSGGYNNSTFSSSTQSDNRVDVLFGNFSTSFGSQRLSTSANYSQSTGDNLGQNSSLLNLSANHYYQVRDNLLFDSFAAFNDNLLTFQSGSGSTENRGRTMQLNTNASWHPEEDEDGNVIPLNVNAGARFANFRNDTTGSSTTNQSLSANVAALYAYSSNLSLSGNGLMTQVSSNNSTQTLTLLAAGANYSGDPRTIGKFDYNWNAGANGSQQTGGSSGSILSLNEQLGHSLSRAIALSETSLMSVNLGQSLSHSSSSQSDSTASLSHNAGANYSTTFSERTQGSVNLNLSDTITTGANASHYNNLTLSSLGTMQINARSSASVNMSIQRSASTTSTLDGLDNRSVTTSMLGTANYQHQRAFGVPRLRYNANLNANTMSRSSDDRLAGNVNATNEDLTYEFDNELNYRIGLLDFQLRGTINSSDGNTNTMIFFRVTRDF